MTLRFAIMGCGRIARRHCEILDQADYAELCGVCDVVPQRADAFASKYHAPGFYDVEQMVRQVKPDVLSILTPSGLHGEHIMQLSPLVQNLVVEKPMVLDLEQADQVIEQCERQGNRLFVVMQNRFNRPVIKLRQAFMAGRFGRLLMGTVRVRWSRDQAYFDQDSWRGSWALDGGVLGNQANHHVDLLEWMMGETDYVSAFSATQLVDVETPTSVVASLQFKSGALGVVEATTSTRPKDLEGSLSVLGEHGTVEIGGFAVNRIRHWHFDPPLPQDHEVMDRYSVNPPDVYGYGHAMYLRHVHDCLRAGTPCQRDDAGQCATGDPPFPCDFDLPGPLEGRRSLQLIKAIYEAARTGKRVKVH